MKSTRILIFVLLINLMSTIPMVPALGVEVYEIGPGNKELLPEGKEADGIIGDFVMVNDLVEVLISGNLPYRKANMGTFWGESNWTPGCLYDLTLKGTRNDQLTVFAPAGQQGKVSYVRIAEGDDSKTQSIETIITSTNNGGIYERHQYYLQDGWNGVVIETLYRNESSEAVEVRTNDEWTRFRTSGEFQGIHWADSVDPDDRCGYAYGLIDWKGSEIPGGDMVTLKPGASLKYARFLAVGTSPAAAVGQVVQWKGGKTISGTVTDNVSAGIPSATIVIQSGDEKLNLYPDVDGKFTTTLPTGSYFVSVSDMGRRSIGQIEVNLTDDRELTFEMGAATSIAFDIRDENGESTPCKVLFRGLGDTPNPDLGPTDRAYGCKDQYHSEKGRFVVNIKPGQYEITVVRGIEFSSLKKQIEIDWGDTGRVAGILKRVVKTPGWISADYHNHSTPSGDNSCGTDDRLINLAAEHIEFAPTTEHNRIYNWAPHIQKLGLEEEIKTVVGIELTGTGTHFNSFPLEEKRFEQDGGAPRWNADPRITAITLENHGEVRADRWIHINHPDMIFNFSDRDGDGLSDGGFLGLSQFVDAIETQNYLGGYLLSGVPYRIIEGEGATPFERAQGATFRVNREFVWLQLLNQGHRMWGIAVADAHTVYGNGVGGWRTYIQSSNDKPSMIRWDEMSRNSKAGKMILTTGPYLEVTAGDGTVAGGYTRGVGGVDLHVRVQCTDWVDIDRVQVLINGRQDPDYNFTRKSHPVMFLNGVVKFDEMIPVKFDRDSHIIVVACGENFDLSGGFGTSTQAAMNPCAYNNPIFVDIDGGGFSPNGDNLGFPLPVGGLSVEEVRGILESSAR